MNPFTPWATFIGQGVFRKRPKRTISNLVKGSEMTNDINAISTLINNALVMILVAVDVVGLSALLSTPVGYSRVRNIPSQSAVAAGWRFSSQWTSVNFKSNWRTMDTFFF